VPLPELLPLLRQVDSRDTNHSDVVAGIINPATCLNFRHSWWLGQAGLRPDKATHLLEMDQEHRTVWELLDHKDVKTTKFCCHVPTTTLSGCAALKSLCSRSNMFLRTCEPRVLLGYVKF
jgi:site-specific recombinase XerD